MESIARGLLGAGVGTLLAVAITRVLGALTEFGRLVAGHIGAPIIVQGFVIALILGVLGGLYPAYRAKNGHVNTFAERLQGCFRYSMNGKAPPRPNATLEP
jgi:ABC-type lipoprotein release transport system permease subunit